MGSGHFTLEETERAVQERLSGLVIDHGAMAAISSIYRAANAVRNHFEREVLSAHGLTWTGWVVMWVIWVWGSIESRHVAAEAGISKSTLTGVVGTLRVRNLVRRTNHPQDGRRVVLRLTRSGQSLMETLMPLFNAQEIHTLAGLTAEQRSTMTDSLQRIVIDLTEARTAD